jgi:hypothetical protein
VNAVARKILNAVSSSPDEKILIESVLSSSTSFSAPTTSFAAEAYSLLLRLLERDPSLHMSCLFVLRLMLLRDPSPVPSVPSFLLDKMSSSPLPFSSLAANVMALCCFSNLLSHSPSSPSSWLDEQTASRLVDVSIGAMGHSRVEVRQMSVALLYNFVLTCTRGGALSGLWTKSVEEIDSLAVQILCGCFDGLAQEADAGVRKRKLSIICRIVRVYGLLAINLIKDLGFADLMEILHQDKNIKPSLVKEEASILAELSVVIKNSA